MSAPAGTNLEFVEAVTELAERGDREALYRLIDGRVLPDAEWMPLIAAGVEGNYVGPDGIRRLESGVRDA